MRFLTSVLHRRDVSDFRHGLFSLCRGVAPRVGPAAGLGTSEETEMNRRCVESNPESSTVRTLA